MALFKKKSDESSFSKLPELKTPNQSSLRLPPLPENQSNYQPYPQESYQYPKNQQTDNFNMQTHQENQFNQQSYSNNNFKIQEPNPLPQLPKYGDQDLSIVKNTLQGPNKIQNPEDYNNYQENQNKYYPPTNQGYEIKEKKELRTIEVPEDYEPPLSKIPRKKLNKEGSVFVKIEKFQNSIENFERIKEKLNEIQETIIKIKRVRSKEEEELKQWELEVQAIKARIENIDNILFDKI